MKPNGDEWSRLACWWKYILPEDDDAHAANAGESEAADAAAEHGLGMEERPCACQPTAGNSAHHITYEQMQHAASPVAVCVAHCTSLPSRPSTSPAPSSPTFHSSNSPSALCAQKTDESPFQSQIGHCNHASLRAAVTCVRRSFPSPCEKSAATTRRLHFE